MTVLQLINRDIRNFFFPKVCRLCDSSLIDTDLYQICDPCLNYISPLSNEERIVFHNEYFKSKINNSFILSHFDDHTRPILHDLKYNHVKSNGILMADLIYNSFANQFEAENIDAILACPLHPKKEMLREYNQAAIIAEQIAFRTGIKYNPNCLHRTKNTKTQTRLSKRQRDNNLNNAFIFKNIENYKNILLIDDVITTGTTILKMTDAIHKYAPNINIYASAFATPYYV